MILVLLILLWFSQNQHVLTAAMKSCTFESDDHWSLLDVQWQIQKTIFMGEEEFLKVLKFMTWKVLKIFHWKGEKFNNFPKWWLFFLLSRPKFSHIFSIRGGGEIFSFSPGSTNIGVLIGYWTCNLNVASLSPFMENI